MGNQARLRVNVSEGKENLNVLVESATSSQKT